LYLWWVNLNDQLQRKRREQYRVFAAGLGKKYGTIFLEKFDLRTVAEKPEPEKDVEHDKEARYQRTKAATSVLRSAVENVCLREGLKFDKIDSMRTTHECPVCGSFINFDAARNLMCRCGSCGGLFDQDYIGAKNVLDRGLHPNEKGTRLVGA
jgi:transposase